MRTVYDADLLLVDDNPDLLRLLSDQLSGAGYRHIRTAANCAAAQTAFACKTPELMILDINLPDGDGFSLFRFLREKVDVPALFLSARDADADRRRVAHNALARIHSFSPRATRTQTACSAWGLAQTTT